MISDWRESWGIGNFPFYFVQLANFMARKDEPSDSAWAELREAQTMTLSLPNTGMAVTIDVGEANDIHPRDKQTVGKRLALIARARDYGQDVEYSGPLYDMMQLQGSRIKLGFLHTAEGLVARDGPLRGFAMAGADRQFHWADAVIEDNSVVVHSDQVDSPVAVRYAWADNPECNLYNSEGLPASPFRTDNWPGITVNTR